MVNRTKLAKRLSYLVCVKMCSKLLTIEACKQCEIAMLINQLAFKD